MKHLRSLILVGVFYFSVTGCNQSPTYSEESPDRALRNTWDHFCLNAELILKHNLLEDHNSHTTWDQLDITDFLAPHSRNSRATIAFFRFFKYARRETVDYRFFQLYANTAGGFEWDCPALRCLFPSKKEVDQSPKNTEAQPS